MSMKPAYEAYKAAMKPADEAYKAARKQAAYEAEK